MRCGHAVARGLARHALLAVCLGPLAAHAADVSLQWRAGLDLYAFHYQEFDPQGRLLDREDGLLPGVAIGLEAHAPPYTVSLLAKGSKGAVDYDGQTQTGRPLTTETDTTLTNLAVALRREIAAGRYSASLLAELGLRRWERDIRPTATTNGMYEVYRWPYFLVGAGVTFWEGARLSVGAQALAGRSFASTLDVHMSGYDTAVLELKAGTTFRVGMPFTYNHPSGRVLTVEPYFDYWHFEQSDSQPLSRAGVTTGARISEPENETASFGLNLSVPF